MMELTPEQITEALKGTKYENAVKAPWSLCRTTSSHLLDKNGNHGTVAFTVTAPPRGSCHPICKYDWGHGIHDNVDRVEANGLLLADAAENAARAILLQRELDAVKAQRDKLASACRNARPYIEEGYNGFGDEDREGAVLLEIDAALAEIKAQGK